MSIADGEAQRHAIHARAKRVSATRFSEPRLGATRAQRSSRRAMPAGETQRHRQTPRRRQHECGSGRLSRRASEWYRRQKMRLSIPRLRRELDAWRLRGNELRRRRTQQNRYRTMRSDVISGYSRLGPCSGENGITRTSLGNECTVPASRRWSPGVAPLSTAS